MTALEYSGVIRRHRNSHQIGPVSFRVESGMCFGLVGANGAGKSTLMRMALGLEQVDEGEIRTQDGPVIAGQPNASATGMIEEPAFFPWLDAAGNLRAAFPADSEIRSKIPGALQQVGLTDVGRQPVRKFSQGMRQRLGIARVLLADAELLVLDEPTNGLDPVGIRWLRTLIQEQTNEGRTVILSSHMLHEVQHSASDFLMLEQGAVVAQGSVREIEQFSSLEEIYFDKIGK